MQECLFTSVCLHHCFLSLYHIVDRSLPAVPVKSRVFLDVAIFLFCQFRLDVRVCLRACVCKQPNMHSSVPACMCACMHACLHVCMYSYDQ